MQVQSLCQEIPWSRKWQPAPLFLPVEFHGQRSLEGYSPWGHKELDTTEHTHTHTHTHTQAAHSDLYYLLSFSDFGLCSFLSNLFRWYIRLFTEIFLILMKTCTTISLNCFGCAP